MLTRIGKKKKANYAKYEWHDKITLKKKVGINATKKI